MRLLESERVQELLARAGLGGLSPRALRSVVVLAAIAIAVGLWRFWPAAPAPEIPFQAPEQAAAPSSESTAPAGEIVVHVAGAVFTPGVYRLPVGSRVTDAVSAAGGGLSTASLDSLNLARILADGEQVYVQTAEEVAAGMAPSAGAATGAATGAHSGGKVNINQASASELESLPGVGPSTAQKIVDDRAANGPFAAPEDLMRVPGIGEKKFESLRDYVVCR